jgi:heavy metal sensor kinase
MKVRSLRFRLASFYAALIASSFVLLGLSMLFGAKHLLEAQLREASARRARLIAQDLLSQIKTRGRDYVIEEIKARFSPEATGRFIRVSSAADGVVLYRSGRPDDQSFDPASIPALSAPPAAPGSRIVAQPNGHSVLVGAAPCRASDGQLYVVEVGASTGPIRDILREFLITLLAGFAAAIAISIAGGWLLIRRALAPVEQMARSAEQISFQNPSLRLPNSPTGDELDRLSLSLNRMLARLEDSYQQTKRFSADASHELRTPLAIMRGELENLAQSPGLDARSRDTLGSFLEEVDRLAKIVENLLALARLDAGDGKSAWESVDLAGLAVSTAEQMCVLALDKGIAIECHAPEPVFVEGDRFRLKQVVVNLLDNAIKFTPRGGKVDLTCESSNGSVLLEVADNGIGIPDDCLARVFDRFYRVDKSRSRNQGGAGIGLSIVKSIVAAHDGTVDALHNQPAGCRFVARLPRRPESSHARQPRKPSHRETAPGQ